MIGVFQKFLNILVFTLVTLVLSLIFENADNLYTDLRFRIETVANFKFMLSFFFA